tara:strand:+ start:1736 stop:2281 length:546 start_codon:yes stop_codon:yes gene_type:complete
MKRINWCHLLLIVLGFFIDSESGLYAQSSIDFSFEKTGPNHSVLVLPVWHPVIKELQELDSLPAEMVLGFDGDSLESGDKVGVFYLDNQENYKCAGSLEWKSNDFNMLPVWGQYPPGADNGMEIGERMIWIAQKKDNSIYQIEATYQKPLMAIYLKDGASAVLGMKLSKRKDLKPLSSLKK